MAGTLLHIDEGTASLDTEPANSNTGKGLSIREGDVLVREVGGGAHVADPANDDRVDGIVVHADRGHHLPEHDEDYTDPVYEGDGNASNGADLTPFGINEEGAVFYPWTVHDNSAPAPSVSKNDKVGIILMDGSAYGSARPVLVEEGYTADPDNTGSDTTYNETNGNFVALGRADEPADGYDAMVPVRITHDI
jgi:hypothetical protein